MPRTARVAPGGLVYHVLNRAAGRTRLFRTEADFEAFQRVLIEARHRRPIRILSYCVMPTHWRFVVWPELDGQLTAFFRWLAHTHAMRWRVARRTVGHGPLYQGRFDSFPVQCDEHLLSVSRYVERIPLSAGLVPRADAWRWSSLWARSHPNDPTRPLLTPWPLKRPANWTARVNAPASSQELTRLRVSLERGRPYGDDEWVARQARELSLEHTIRPVGRPPKAIPPGSPPPKN